ncbi:hypothetical protein CVT24_005279 [Panaeolus cyanescens]|uniref:Uncharacterized protein n=1 Tax=Panaeolus cyanescens TaxID=181874 RepID=A0A409Y946_9AGAR|nr:hypothetical protein CVT24_005279 [Panaeolus cyanescens]
MDDTSTHDQSLCSGKGAYFIKIDGNVNPITTGDEPERDTMTVERILQYLSSNESMQKGLIDIITNIAKSENSHLTNRIEGLQYAHQKEQSETARVIHGLQEENANLRKELDKHDADRARMIVYHTRDIKRLKTAQQKYQSLLELEKEKLRQDVEDLRIVVQRQQGQLDDVGGFYEDQIDYANRRRESLDAENNQLWTEVQRLRSDLQDLNDQVDVYLVPILLRALIDKTRQKIMDLFPEYSSRGYSMTLEWFAFKKFLVNSNRHLCGPHEDIIVQAIHQRLLEAYPSCNGETGHRTGGWLSETALRVVSGEDFRKSGHRAAHPHDLRLLRDAVERSANMSCFHDLQQMYCFVSGTESF